MTYNLTAYIIYVLISVFTIIYIGKVLHRNGIHFIRKLLPDELLATNINDSLLVAYYVLNIGYVLLTLQYWEDISGIVNLTEVIGNHVSKLYLLLGCLHFFNIYAINKYAQFRKTTLRKLS